MNKVGLSLSILSLCWLISTTGWAGEFFYNNPLCCLSSKPATPNNTPSQDSQPTEETPASIPTMPPAAPPTQPIPIAICGQKTTITDSNGRVTTIETTCNQRSTNY